MHGNKACCEDVYQPAATVSIVVLVICFASTQRTDGQASGVSANELARRILMNELGAEQRDQSHWSFRLDTQKPNDQNDLKRAAPFDDPEWIFELKYDGFRALAVIEHGRANPLYRVRVSRQRYAESRQRPGCFLRLYVVESTFFGEVPHEAT